MENQMQQTNATPSDNPMAGVFNKVLNVLMEEMNKLIDARVERIMATAIHDEVVSALNDLDLCDEVERVFRNRVDWEGMVASYIDNRLDEVVETTLAGSQDKMCEVLIDILKRGMK